MPLLFPVTVPLTLPNPNLNVLFANAQVESFLQECNQTLCDCEGIKGRIGTIGFAGVQGSEGPAGDMGPPGNPGFTGEKGDVGEYGEQGEKGHRVSA